MTQLTRDHSWVQMWVDLGQMTPEEAAVSPSRNAILRAVGIDSKVESDLFTVDFTDSENATILLCSDGLSDYLAQEDIFSIINDSALSLDDRTSALIEGANKGGGGDNITAVLFEIE
jgi:protein phosphatase